MGVALKGNALAAQLLCGFLHIHPFEWHNAKTGPQSPIDNRDWGPAYGIGTKGRRDNLSESAPCTKASLALLERLLKVGNQIGRVLEAAR